jgi:hypothetical protein
MVDPWKAPKEGDRWKEAPGMTQHKSQQEFDRCYETVLGLASRYGERAKVIRGRSLDVVGSVPDGTLDYVFIDAEHTYEGVKEDALAWLAKVKEGGWIGGHDYANGRFVGVKEAVDEVFADRHIELNIDHTWFVTVEGGKW